MRLKFVENPELRTEEIAALRSAVGWDERKEQMQKIVGCTYMSAACLDGDRLVGWIDVISDGVDDAFIRNLVVDPAYQRRGIGLQLLKMVAGRIKKDRIKTANVLFEPELAALYRKAGFRIISGGMIDNEAERLDS